MTLPLIDKLAWIHIKDRKILFVRSFGKDVFYTPGGKRVIGETDEQVLCREIQEELGVELKSESLSHLCSLKDQAHGMHEGCMINLTCYTGEYEGELKPSSEIEEMIWVGIASTTPITTTGRAILQLLNKRGIID
jgi:8-oxo-dGTP pyrophosphatase MutT (NUDIX family)